MNLPLALDDETQWPARLSDALQRGMLTLKAYEHERQKRAAESTSWEVRWNQPPNEHTAARAQVIEEVAHCLHGTSILGYHCTRLLPEEIDVIRTDGFRVLSEALVTEKLRRAERLGLLSAEVATLVAKRHLAHDRGPGRRLGTPTLLLVVRDLTTREGCLASSRSGVAKPSTRTSRRHTRVAAAALQQLGEPSIVVCALPTQRLSLGAGGIARALVGGYLRRRGVQAEHSSDIEGDITEDLQPSCVLTFLRGDELEAATGFAG